MSTAFQFTRCLRSCGHVACPHATPSTPTVEQCVICQEDMDVQDAVVRLRCDHAFHGTCITTHLRGDNRCPVCRDDPFNDGYEESFDDEEEDTPRVTVKTALKAARAAAKTNKNVKKSLETLKKWKKTAKEARKKLKHAHNELRPVEDSIEDKISAFESKEWAMFNRKHKKQMDEMEEYRRTVSRAHSYARAAKYRIAKRYGWGSRNPTRE